MQKILIQFSDDGSSQFMQAVAFGANKITYTKMY